MKRKLEQNAVKEKLSSSAKREKRGNREQFQFVTSHFLTILESIRHFPDPSKVNVLLENNKTKVLLERLTCLIGKALNASEVFNFFPKIFT